MVDATELECEEDRGVREIVDVLLVKSVTVKAVVSGKYVVVTPVAKGTEVVLEKPTGEPKLELEDGVMALAETEVPV